MPVEIDHPVLYFTGLYSNSFSKGIPQMSQLVYLFWLSNKQYVSNANATTRCSRPAGSQYRCGRVGRGIQPPFTPPPPHSNVPKKYLKRSFSHFLTRWPPTDRRTNGPMDGRTDKASYRIACAQLKSYKGLLHISSLVDPSRNIVTHGGKMWKKFGKLEKFSSYFWFNDKFQSVVIEARYFFSGLW